jgi:hypothetical protein
VLTPGPVRWSGGVGNSNVAHSSGRVAKVQEALAIQPLRARTVRGSDGDEGRDKDTDDNKDGGHRNGSRDGHDVCFGGSIVSK